MKKLIHKLFGLMNLSVRRIQVEKPDKGTAGYFNTGLLTPLEENSEELYDAFYKDEAALKEYYSDSRRTTFYSMLNDFFIKEKVDFTQKKILDAGCGIGFLLNRIQQNHRPLKLSGSDFSQKAVDFSKTQFQNIDFFRHDLNYPILEKYDIIICTEVLEHLQKPHIAVKNMLDALEVGGTLILTVPNGRNDYAIEHINFWSPESWTFFLERECKNCKIKTDILANAMFNINIGVVTLPS